MTSKTRFVFSICHFLASFRSLQYFNFFREGFSTFFYHNLNKHNKVNEKRSHYILFSNMITTHILHICPKGIMFSIFNMMLYCPKFFISFNGKVRSEDVPFLGYRHDLNHGVLINKGNMHINDFQGSLNEQRSCLPFPQLKTKRMICTVCVKLRS